MASWYVDSSMYRGPVLWHTGMWTVVYDVDLVLWHTGMWTVVYDMDLVLWHPGM